MDFTVLPATGELKGNIFAYPVRVYYEDTDAGGIVYYANYLKFAERARTEFLRHFNFEQQKDLLADDKTGFVVRSCSIDYLSSARLDDALLVTCEILEQGGASLVVRQEIYRDSTVLARLELKLVYMSMRRGRPIRLPFGKAF